MDLRDHSRFSSGRWILCILILAFVLRLYHLGDPPWDYHNWRQTITLMVARDFARHGFNLLHPHVLWIANNRPSDPSYFSGEFSIQSVVAALLYRLFGESEASARIVVIAFSLLGIWFLYDLVKRRAGAFAACLAAFVYSMLPYHLFFGRVFMPEVPALSLAIGALDALDRWSDNRTWGRLLAAAALAALAVLEKLTVAFIALPALYLFWLAYGKRLVVRLEPYVFALTAGLAPLAWYIHSVLLSRESGFAIMQPVRFGRDLQLWLEPSFLQQILTALSVEAFSPVGLFLIIIGVFWPISGRAAWIFRWWVVGASLLLAVTPNLLPQNHYYLSLLLPGGAGLAGLGLTRLAPNRSNYPLLTVVLALFAADASYSALPLYVADRWPWELGRELNGLTAANDLIITESGGSPNMLYFADRRGWMLNRQYNLAVIERLAAAGARYYADVFAADIGEQREFFRALDARYERLALPGEHSRWPVYRLSSPATPH